MYATAFLVSGPAAAELLNAGTNQPAQGQQRGGRGGWSMVYLSFADWKDAPNARLFYMDTVQGFGGYKCAPEVFYFAPHKKWYIIFQTQPPAYCTSETPDDPKSWSAPQPFFAPGTPLPRLPIDYHCIGDGELYVYTPPGYDRTKTYPVLCLVGGSGELPSNWIYDGRANFIMDNLLVEKKAAGRMGQRCIALHDALTKHNVRPEYYVGGDSAHD